MTWNPPCTFAAALSIPARPISKEQTRDPPRSKCHPSAQELSSSDPTSEPSKAISPRRNDGLPKECEKEAQRKNRLRTSYYLRHHFPNHRPRHDLEDGWALDTENDPERIVEKMASIGASDRALDQQELAENGLACIVAQWESNQKQQKRVDAGNGAGATLAIVKRVEDEGKESEIGRPGEPQSQTFAADDVPALLPAPESSSPLTPPKDADIQSLSPPSSSPSPLTTYSLHGIDSLPHLSPAEYAREKAPLAPRPFCFFEGSCPPCVYTGTCGLYTPSSWPANENDTLFGRLHLGALEYVSLGLLAFLLLGYGRLWCA
jgi:hypothetical protein